MPEVPALALVVEVATVIPVVSVVVVPVPACPPTAVYALLPLSIVLRITKVWLWPGSVTVDVEVAVCVCVGSVASAEPPVASTA